MVGLHIEHWSVPCAYCAVCVYCASCMYVMHIVHLVHGVSVSHCHAEAMENSGLKPEVCGMQ